VPVARSGAAGTGIVLSVGVGLLPLAPAEARDRTLAMIDHDTVRSSTLLPGRLGADRFDEARELARRHSAEI
jgi:hypothetical protein